MIEKVLLDYLNAADLSAEVFMEQPKGKPAAFFLLEKTGGMETEHIFESTFAVQSYGRTLLEAARMNEEIKAAMRDAIALETISRVELNGDYNYTEPITKQYRYQAVFVITHY